LVFPTRDGRLSDNPVHTRPGGAVDINTLFNTVSEVNLFGGPVPIRCGPVDWFAAGVASAAFIGLWHYRCSVVPILGVSPVAGLVYTLTR
jgi:hypothetical protein